MPLWVGDCFGWQAVEDVVATFAVCLQLLAERVLGIRVKRTGVFQQ